MVTIFVKPHPRIASITIDEFGNRKIVTTAEALRHRQEYQHLRLARLRETHPWRAVKLWVACFDQPLMGGWHAFLEDRNG